MRGRPRKVEHEKIDREVKEPKDFDETQAESSEIEVERTKRISEHESNEESTPDKHQDDESHSESKKEIHDEPILNNQCPYCLSVKANSIMNQDRNMYSCQTCGKSWRKEDLGKKYSLELERGEHWSKEMQVRNILKK